MNMKFFVLLTLCLLLCPVLALAQGCVDINTGSLAQIEELDGIGPTKAQSIIDSRPYSFIDDLDRVKGIGPATLQKIKDQGLASISCASTQPTPQNNNEAKTAVDGLPSTPIVYPGGVYINEILPNPKGDDSLDEWIELYNSNNFDVDLSGWQIQDIAGTIATFTILHDTEGTPKILAGGFLVFKRPDIKIMLNNDGDGINLLTPDKKIVDSAIFASAPLGQSYNKTNSVWQWSLTSTPGTKNIITSITTKTLPSAKNSVKNDGVALGLASLNQIINTNQDGNDINNPWFLFFMVLAITIILSAIVLFIKLKFLKNYVRT